MIRYVERRQTQVKDRRVPRWAAALLDDLSAERPPVVSLSDVADRQQRVGLHRDSAVVVEELQRLGWLQRTGVRGAWAFLPPGENELNDPYLDLRALQATQPDRTFYISGDTAAFHLGLLDRCPESIQLWLPDLTKLDNKKGGIENPALLPHRLRTIVSIVKLPFPTNPGTLEPSAAQFRNRRLDRLRWASGFRGFGPDALLAQLAIRPSSFTAWFDLSSHLTTFTEDIDINRAALLLHDAPKSAWQRCAYLLDAAGHSAQAGQLFAHRPAGKLAITHFGQRSSAASTTPNWSPEFQVIDNLLRPLLAVIGKA